ncbi:MAG: glycosyltransferase family 9 protein [bacterium]
MAERWLSTNLLRPFFKKGQDTPFLIPGTLSSKSRLLAIDTGDLSDLLWQVPLLRGIQATYPGCRVDFLAPEEHTPLIAPCGLARQCLVYTAKQLRPLTPAFWSLLRSVRQSGYDVALVMSLSPQPICELIALASGAVLRLGPAHHRAYPAVNFEIRPPDRKTVYLGDRSVVAAPFLGLETNGLERAWPLPDDKVRRVRQLVHFNKPRKDELLVGVDSGLGKSGHGLSLQNLHFLIQQLTSQAPCRVLPLSTPRHRDRMARLASKLTSSVPGLVQETLLDTVLLLTQCDLFVAGNTDLFHFAVALDVPTIGLFTVQDGQEWDPGPRPAARVLRVAKGQRVDIDTLMEAVETVTASRSDPGQESGVTAGGAKEPT